MNYGEMGRAQFLVGRNGGEIRCIDMDGQVIWELGLAAGQYSAAKYQPLMSPSDTIEVSDGVSVVLMHAQRVQRSSYGEGAFDTGANPDWRPAQGTEAMLKSLERKIADISKQNNTLARKAAALEKVNAEKQKVLDAEAAAQAEAEALAAKRAAEVEALSADAVQNEAVTAE